MKLILLLIPSKVHIFSAALVLKHPLYPLRTQKQSFPTIESNQTLTIEHLSWDTSVSLLPVSLACKDSWRYKFQNFKEEVSNDSVKRVWATFAYPFTQFCKRCIPHGNGREVCCIQRNSLEAIHYFNWKHRHMFLPKKKLIFKHVVGISLLQMRTRISDYPDKTQP
jgi:hypothetical protein